jgi:hypothetical protein
MIPGLAAGDMDMDGTDEIFALREIFTLDAGKNIIKPSWAYQNDNDIFSNDTEYDFVWMGDVTGDKKSDIVMIPTYSNNNWLQIISLDSSTHLVHWEQKLEGDDNHFPVVALPNVDKDSYVLEFQGHELLFGDPEILTILASPPYWEGTSNMDGETSYGEGQSSGSSYTDKGGFSVGFSVGVKTSHSILGIATITEAEFKTTVENSFSWGVTKSKELSETYSYTASTGEDQVIFTAVPFDVYYYKVLSAPDEAIETSEGKDTPEIGGTLTISVPRKPGFYNATTEFYNQHNGDTWDVKLPHELGKPLTYAKEAEVAAIKSKAGGKGLFTTTSFLKAGQGGGHNSRSVEDVKTEEKNFDYEFSTEFEAQVTAGTVLVGMNSKFSYGHSTANSTSSSLFIEGSVPHIPGEMYSADKDFRWGLMMYPTSSFELDSGAKQNQKFNYVTYWVDN